MFISLQVLSASVANALEYHGDSDSTETAKFVRLFDRFFDCFNARSIDECIKKRKPDLGPYRDPSDSRLSVRLLTLMFNVYSNNSCMQWLKDTFLKYLRDWQDSVKARKDFTPTQQGKMCLSTQTLEGIEITGIIFYPMKSTR